jgi:proteic killer suppression protein
LLIRFSKRAEKQFKKAPVHIQERVAFWIEKMERLGRLLIRLQYKSFRDEPLQGDRKGQRSIRLNKQWRLIYEEQTHEIIEVQEITPHDYRTR